MTKIPNSKWFKFWKFENLDLYRLPARSRFGEGRDLDIRISDFSPDSIGAREG
jgi:hypothetical protein